MSGTGEGREPCADCRRVDGWHDHGCSVSAPLGPRWRAAAVPASTDDEPPNGHDGLNNAQRLAQMHGTLRVTEAASLRARLAAAEARLARVRELHQADPDGGTGYRDDGTYGPIDSVCQQCGTPDEYGAPWPCATYLAASAPAPTGEDCDA